MGLTGNDALDRLLKDDPIGTMEKAEQATQQRIIDLDQQIESLNRLRDEHLKTLGMFGHVRRLVEACKK